MIFNFSFNDSLDFTKFKKQSNHYLYVFKDRDIEYNLSVSNYKLVCKAHAMTSNTNKVNINSRLVSVKILEITKDKDGDVINGQLIVPSSNNLFKDIKQINDLFQPHENIGEYFASSTTEIVDFMCRTVKLLSKVNNLLVFI